MDAHCPAPEDRETGAELYDLPAAVFEQHMAFLKDNGYEVVTAAQASVVPNDKQVVLTFDDGELNNFQIALPILKKYNFPAYFFIIAGKVGKQGYMSWEDIRALRQAGMIVGSHGLSHQILTNLMDSQMDEELRASKRTIEVNLNITVETLSIPRGFCNDALIAKAYELGYKTIFISERPRELKSACLSRIAVKSRWTIEHLKRALEGRMTRMESALSMSKKIIKRVLREGGYNRLRSLLIKMFQ